MSLSIIPPHGVSGHLGDHSADLIDVIWHATLRIDPRPTQTRSKINQESVADPILLRQGNGSTAHILLQHHWDAESLLQQHVHTLECLELFLSHGEAQSAFRHDTVVSQHAGDGDADSPQRVGRVEELGLQRFNRLRDLVYFTTSLRGASSPLRQESL